MLVHVSEQGGCCKICEAVTHLAKDCPQKNSGKFAGNARVKLKICKFLTILCIFVTLG